MNLKFPFLDDERELITDKSDAVVSLAKNKSVKILKNDTNPMSCGKTSFKLTITSSQQSQSI